MSQEPQVVATADARRLGRALLLLGGFVLLWWCLATGTAQADDGTRGLDKATRGVAGTVERTVHQPVRNVAMRAQKATRPGASKALRTVHQRAASATLSPAVRVVEKTVRTTPAKPVLDAAVAAHASVVPVLERTRQTVERAVLGTAVIPELEGLGIVRDALPPTSESSILQGQTPFSQAVGGPSTTLSDTTFVDASLAGLDRPSAVAVDHLDRVAAGSPATPWDNHGLGARGGSNAAATAQSGGGSAAGSALCAAALDIGPDATEAPIASLADRHPADPAYQPSCSPD